MACFGQKTALGFSLAGLGGAGVIAVVGAPTVLVTAAGVAGAVGAFGGVIASMIALQDCYERNRNIEAARKLATTVQRLKDELIRLCVTYQIPPPSFD